MRLSVIIPCRNAAHTLPEQLAALRDQKWDQPWEVVVALNQSTDGSADVLYSFRDSMPQLTIVRANGRRGAAHARNVGVRASRGEWLAFTDADDVVAPGWVAAMGASLTCHPVVVGRLEFERLNGPAVRATHRPYQQVGPQEWPTFLPHGAGCNLGVWRERHTAIGGFDESWLRLQDTDYCWRLQQAGERLHFEPSALVHYRLRSGLGALWMQTWSYGRANARLYQQYCYPAGLTPAEVGYRLNTPRDLLRRLRRVRSRADLLVWLWKCGWRLGWLHGMLELNGLWQDERAAPASAPVTGTSPILDAPTVHESEQ